MKLYQTLSWGVAVAALSVGLPPLTGHAGSVRMEPANIVLSVEVVARDLYGPSGLAIEPESGDVFVAEQAGNRVSRIHQKRLYAAFPGGFKVTGDLPDWALDGARTGDDWTFPGFRNPSGVAFDKTGTMYVSEAGETSRVLSFPAQESPDAEAELLTTPWMRGNYTYTGIRSDPDGRLYLSVRKAEEDVILPFGNVLKREVDGVWWMIDYGPFADFGSPAIDPAGEFVVLAERRTADVCWYDTDLEVCIGAMEDLAGIRHVTIAPGGITLAALEKENGTWSVVELDARDSEIREWIGGLTEIGDLCVDWYKNDLYVSLREEGRVIRVSRVEDKAKRSNALVDLRRRFRAEHDLPPAEWPEFFRGFISNLNVVEPINRWDEAGDERLRSMTLGEFAEAIPLVAAKVKTTLLSPAALEPDPIEEVSFVQFYPDKMNLSENALAPSLSLFCAKHRSGKRHLSKVLMPGDQPRLVDTTTWEDLPNVLLPTPYGTRVSPDQEKGGKRLHVFYVDMFGISSRLYDIAIDRENPEESIMTVRTSRAGADNSEETRVDYRIEVLPEKAAAGGTTVLVADHMVQKSGWYEVSDFPMMWNIVTSQPEQLSLRHSISAPEMAAKDVQVGEDLAENFQKRTVRRDVQWRRELIKQSAVQWAGTHF